MVEPRPDRARASMRPPGPGLTRRGFLLGSSALGLASVAGCGAMAAGENVNAAPTIAPADGPVTLTYWAWLKDLQRVCDIFNDTQDRIRVEAAWIPGGDGGGYAKILSAVAAGGGPDIAQVELRSVPEFALAGALVELSRYGAADHESAFDPGAWSQVAVGDSVWAIPQDTGPGAFFYNREMLEEIGGAPPATWPEWRELAQEVKGSGNSRWIATLDPGDGSFPVFVAMQAGAQWFRPEGDGWIIDMAGDATLEVAEFWDGVIADELVGTGYGPFTTPWMAAAGQNQILSYTGGSWGDALIEGVPDGAGRWAVAPMPRWEDMGFASAMLGGSSAAVMAHSEHPAEALEFLVWMCTDPAGIDAMVEFSGIGWSPAADYIGAVREQPSEFFSGQSYNEEVIQPMAEGQNLDWVWPPMTQRLNNILGDGMRARVTGGAPLVDFFPRAQNEVLRIMRDVGLDAEVAS
ncbi:ABC transporter substrate-binding protein [Georgenia alba]|uniref:ABC transporter substrate-binding protein n=1 Tax=Georgenia alba TaxID=2233858 RepID=A0ABW2Q9D6_9MICO